MLRPLPIFLALVLLLSSAALATEFNLGSALSGTNFRILDPQHAGFGGTSSSSSSNFRLLGTIGDLAIGSASATTFGLRSGFLYFPFIQAPTLTTATPGVTQVSLSWTGATAQAGLSVSGYNVCTKPGAGSYTCQDVGLVLAFTKTGLTGGTSHTFKIQAYDVYDNVIAESNELTATPTAAGGGGGGGGGGSSGGGGFLPPSGSSSIELTGLAYPGAPVHVLQDGVELGSTTANTQGVFTFTRNNVVSGPTVLGIWAVDAVGRRSLTLAFTVTLTGGVQNRIGGIILPPTISLSSNLVVLAEPVTVDGSSAPGATVRIDLDTAAGRQQTTLANSDGIYSTTLPTIGLLLRIYNVKARTELPPGGDTSTWSQLLRLAVGVPLFPEAGVPVIPTVVCVNGPDINRSGLVDLVDFSIMAFWWRKPVAAGASYDLNCDGQLTLADFSILAFHWTGR